jgi:hypothetical protein
LHEVLTSTKCDAVSKISKIIHGGEDCLSFADDMLESEMVAVEKLGT